MCMAGEHLLSSLFNESHHITDPFSLSLSSFYTLNHNIMWCNPITKLVLSNIFTFSTYMKTLFHAWRNLSGKFQCYQTNAEPTFLQLADILSFIPHRLKKERFCTEFFRWRDFIIWGNNNECKRLTETKVEVNHIM
jgi:hypothetical protein